MMIRIFTLCMFLLLASTSVHATSKDDINPDPAQLWLRSHAAIVMDQQSGELLYQKNADDILPIASITKIMTAIIVIDAELDMEEAIRIAKADKDTIKYSRSRLPVNSVVNRMDLLRLALMASENRAAAALARTYPGGQAAFINAMNTKSKALGMQDTQFSDSTGLIATNQSTAKDLTILLKAAWQYPLIRRISGLGSGAADIGGKTLEFNNTNRLLRRAHWQIGMSKTGYIKESGRCLVMQTHIAGRDLFIILLNAQGKLSSYGDSGRIRKWLETYVNEQRV